MPSEKDKNSPFSFPHKTWGKAADESPPPSYGGIKGAIPLVVLGILVRIPGLSDSFYGDEAFSLLRDSSQLITSSEDRFRPVFFSLLYLWRQLGFSGEIGLRLLPLLFGVAQIPLAYAIGKQMHSARAGAVFAFLIAVSPLLVEFSQELRMYSLVTLCALFQWWLYLQLRNRPSWNWTLWFVLVALLGVYTHLHYWLYLFGFSLLFWAEKSRIQLRLSLSGLGVVLLLYLPNIPNILRFTHERGEQYAMDLISALPKLLAAFTVGYNYFVLPDTGAVREIGASVFRENLLLIALAAIPILFLIRRFLQLHGSADARNSILLFHTLFTVPVMLALIAALLTQKNWLQPKYLIFSAPALLWAFTLAFLNIGGVKTRVVMLLSSCLLFAIALWHFNDPVHYGRREDWRGAAQLLKQNASAPAPLLIVDGAWGLLTFYDPVSKSNWIELGNPSAYPSEAALADTLHTRLANRSSVYYLRVDTFQNVVDPDDRLPRALDKLGWRSAIVQLNPRLHLMKWNLDLSPGERQ